MSNSETYILNLPAKDIDALLKMLKNSTENKEIKDDSKIKDFLSEIFLDKSMLQSLSDEDVSKVPTLDVVNYIFEEKVERATKEDTSKVPTLEKINSILSDESMVISVDSELSSESTNPVQNKIIVEALTLKANTSEIESLNETLVVLNETIESQNNNLNSLQDQIEEKASIESVNNKISESDLIEYNFVDQIALENAVEATKNDLLNGAGEAYDTLKELGDLIVGNEDAIKTIEEIALNKADKDELLNHLNKTNNPHGVTASQIGALSVNGGTVNNNVIILGSNPRLGLRDTSGKDAYFQTFEDGNGLQAGFGYGWTNSLKLTQDGSVSFCGATRPQWNGSPLALKNEVPSNKETWTFTLEDGSVVTKEVYVG